MPFKHRVAFVHAQPLDDTADLGVNDVFHFHGFHH